MLNALTSIFSTNMECPLQHGMPVSRTSPCPCQLGRPLCLRLASRDVNFLPRAAVTPTIWAPMTPVWHPSRNRNRLWARILWVMGQPLKISPRSAFPWELAHGLARRCSHHQVLCPSTHSPSKVRRPLPGGLMLLQMLPLEATIETNGFGVSPSRSSVAGLPRCPLPALARASASSHSMAL